MRVLGIDYGSKRVGVALGDTETRIANAWEVVLNDSGMEALAMKIVDIAGQEQVEKIIVGIPRPLKDASFENDQVREIRGFILALKEAGLDVVEWDEALTSKVAAQQEQESRPLTAAGRPSSKGGKRDDLAAAVILQNWLDRH
jgi:putative Holliday junction resolvase